MSTNLIKKSLYEQGFTLVELSIVIIIIGFLIAGIAAGNSLIKQTALNTIISESSEYITALNVFKSRYNSYPGDFADANSYWPTAVSGDGDGLVEWFIESQDVWNQLVLAGILSKTVLSVSDEYMINARFKGTIWKVESQSDQIYTVLPNTRNSLGIQSIAGAPLYFITGNEAYNIDQKTDDGIPSNGKVQTFNLTECVKRADGVTNADYTYNSTQTLYNLAQTTPEGCYRIVFYLD